MSNAKQVQRRYIEEVWNNGKLESALELLAPGATLTGLGRASRALDGLAGVLAFRSAFPDIKLTVEQQIEEGGTVTARWRATGTNTGSLHGFPATGRRVSFEGHTIDTIQGGRITSSFVNMDPMELFLQAGIQPQIDRNKAAVLRFYAEVCSSGKYDTIGEIFAPEVRVGSRGEVGTDAVRARIKGYRTSFPDLTFEVVGQVSEGDYVSTTWVARGHHRAPLMDIPATGRYVTFQGSSIEKVVGGHIHETNIVFDVLELVVQLGAEVRRDT
jgi:predicted ester cyclase